MVPGWPVRRRHTQQRCFREAPSPRSKAQGYLSSPSTKPCVAAQIAYLHIGGMSDVAIAETTKPRRDASKPMKVTGKLRHALHLMVWDCKTDNEAAVQVGMTVDAIRLALRQPHVRSHYFAEREVLRASMMPKNIHRLAAIRDKADNMPAVNAIKLLEELGADQQARGSAASASPGVTIRILQIVQQAPTAERHSDPECRTLEITKG